MENPFSENNVLTGKQLRELEIISDAELQAGVAAQQISPHLRIGEILFEQTGSSRFRICEEVAGMLGVEWVRPDKVEIAPEALESFSAQLATHYNVIPIALEGDTLTLATASPQDMEQLDEIEMLCEKSIRPVLAMKAHLAEAIKRRYGLGAETIERMSKQDGEELQLEDLSHHALDDTSTDASIIRFVNQIILDAYRLNATDIHFEPEEESFRIRYRIDGMLEEITVPPAIKRYQSAIVSRIKVMSRLNISEQRLPQDGRIQVKHKGEAFDMRVSVLPTPLGEAVDLRLLRRTNIHLTLDQLGYTHENLRLLETAALSPYGIILVTGPTGSGKTTSLYALLRTLNTKDKKIITTEDPIEYRLPGTLQMQVHEEIGFTFARALRSILRHDPDIILVGEIRDNETAEIAIRMSMTGHLVLSTLHTNDSASTLGRLIDMDQEPYLLASTIIQIVAQRLIRVNCTECMQSYIPDDGVLLAFQQLQLAQPEQFLHGVGCERCRNTGFGGRSGIHEIMPMDDEFRQLTLEHAPASAFRALSRKKKLPLMQEDGWARVCQGRTTPEELMRVTQIIEF